MLEDEFRKAGSACIIFKGKKIYLFDTIFLPAEKAKLILRFHKVKSRWSQGVCLCDMPSKDSRTRFTIAGQAGPAVELWTDTSPKEVEIDVFAPNGKFNVYNIWDTGNGQCRSQVAGGGMLVEVSENGRKRYYKCNDGHPKPEFKHLEFSIEIITLESST